MDVLSVLTTGAGTVSIQVALIVGHIVYLSVSMRSMRKEFDDHKQVMGDEVRQIKEDMGKSDIILHKLKDDMTKVLTSLLFIQESLREIKENRKK